MAKKSVQALSGGVPVPSHLTGWVVPKSWRDEVLTAAVRCPCGSEQLEFHHPGATLVFVPGEEPCPAGEKVGDASFFLIKAVCVACRKENVLFDCDFHGHDGFLLRDEKQAAIPRPRLWPWRCLACGSAAHTGEVSLILDYQDRYFEKGYAKKFGADRWPDAFGSIGMGIKCCGCGHEAPRWVEYETR
jgi:hypothetical protein